MSSVQDAGQQVNQALDKIMQAKDNPQQLQQAVNDAKQKVQQLIQQAQQNEQGQQGQRR
jgi:predicted outer membrane protein